MNTATLTTGQKNALLTSLMAQKSPKTPAEKATEAALFDELAEIVTIEGTNTELYLFNGKVKHVNLDTCGDNYRNCWMKLNETSKGEYFTSSYYGNSRKYIN